MNQAGFQPLTDEPRRWDVLAGFMAQQDYKTFVEVGCKEGRTTGHILKTIPDARVVAIDPWIVQEKSADKTKETYEDWDFAKIEAEFWANVGEHKDRCFMRRMTSSEAAEQITNPRSQSDLVFIDALHDYEHVKQDIALWWPKVRIGGILSGHDFNHKWPGCERAVAESFNLMHVGVAPDSVWFVIKVAEDQFRG
ncbi:MAG: class I SAM-dependent methyltransferase [Gemmatimonadales bacterium]